jgi:hypothetical protein
MAFLDGVGTNMHASTRALEDDEAVSSRSVSGVAQPLSGEEIGPQAEYREQGNTRQRRDQTPMGTRDFYPIGRDHSASNWVDT